MPEIASAFVSIIPETRGFGSKLNSQVGSSVKSSGSTLGRTFGKLFVLGAGVIAAAGIGNLLKGSIDEAREAQKVGAATEAIIKATGGAAKITAEDVGKMAGRLSAVTGIDDEAIQSGSNLLLTFKNVKNYVDGQFVGTFDRATASAVDLSAAGFGSIESASKTLGKALNDPIKGVAALSRAGVTFSDQQKEQIKTMVESGNVLGAQNIILKEVEGQVGGVAAATATSGEKASVALGNLKEQIGTALLPVIDRLASTFTTRVAPAISAFVTQLQSGEGAGGRVAAVLTMVASTVAAFVGQIKSGQGAGGQFAAVIVTLATALGTVFSFINNNRETVGAFVGIIATAAVVAKAFAAAQLLVNLALTANPIGIVVVAIAALVAGLVYAYRNSEKFRAVVDAVFGFLGKFIPKVIGAVVGFVKSHWKLLIVLILGPLGLLIPLVIKHFDKIKAVVGAAADFVVASAKKYAQFVKAVIEKVGQVVSFFKELPGKIKGIVSRIPDQLKKLGGQMIDGLVSGLKAAAHKVEEVVQSIIDKIPKKIRKIMGIASPSKVTEALGKQIGEGLARGIERTTDKVGQATEKLTKKVKEKVTQLRDTLSTLKGDFASLVDPIASAFTGNLFEGTTASKFVSDLLGTKGRLTGLISAFKTLTNQGLNPKFLYDLFQSGNAGLILDLAANPALAGQAGGLFGEINQLSTTLGQAVAGATPDGKAITAKIDQTNAKLDKLIKATKDNAREVGAEVNGAAGAGHRRGKHGGRRAA